MRKLLNKYPHIKVIIIYSIFYLCFFMYLESRDIVIFNTETFIDSYIPFCEYFIIFYLLWFIYIFFAVFYFTFFEIEKFIVVAKYLMIGMTVCLIIDLIIPNGISLRPALTNDNIFQELVSFVYSLDTSTNVFPSIHVYNSIVIGYALNRSHLFQEKEFLKVINNCIVLLICASTVLLKQHAFIDIVAAVVLAIIIICLINKGEERFLD
ncbi:MAG: phosphatase PAP2 family protein [Bacilli bacterium]|nr:phosphatase PAP2 family protein [Bacilli bacterium]